MLFRIRGRGVICFLSFILLLLDLFEYPIEYVCWMYDDAWQCGGKVVLVQHS